MPAHFTLCDSPASTWQCVCVCVCVCVCACVCVCERERERERERETFPGHREKPECPIIWGAVSQSSPFLCDPIDYSPPGSSVHGIFQASILEWVAMPSSRGSSRPRDRTHISRIVCIGRQILYHWCHLGSRTCVQAPC